MRKIITFLGKYPNLTTYEYQGKTYTGQVFAEALRQFVQFDQMLVFVTDEAKEKAWPILEALHDSRIQPVPIQIGETSEEMWSLFDEMASRVDVGETVIFDITHGLRSIPFLVFLFAAYLKSAKKVTIEAIYYGAFELGDKENQKPAPVLDLSEFVRMLDRLTAADRFNQTGDAQRLAALLRDEKNHLVGNDPSDQTLRDLTKPMGILASNLRKLSQSLRVLRPFMAVNEAAKLIKNIGAARQPLEQVARTRPLFMLLESIQGNYESLALKNAKYDSKLVENLHIQRKMIHWYAQREQWVQAVSLAREWLVSWFMVKLKMSDLITEREQIEEHIRVEARSYRDALTQKVSFSTNYLKDIPEKENALDLWNKLVEVRNDIDHVGMNKNPKSPEVLIKKIRDYIQESDNLPIEE